MPEWSNGAVSKTDVLSRVPRVRIPVSPPSTPGTGLSLQGPDTSRGSVGSIQVQSLNPQEVELRLRRYQGRFAWPVSAPIAIGWVSLLCRELTGNIFDFGPETGLFRASGRNFCANTCVITGGCSRGIPLSLFFAITGYLIAITGSDIAHSRACYGAEQGAP